MFRGEQWKGHVRSMCHVIDNSRKGDLDTENFMGKKILEIILFTFSTIHLH